MHLQKDMSVVHDLLYHSYILLPTVFGIWGASQSSVISAAIKSGLATTTSCLGGCQQNTMKLKLEKLARCPRRLHRQVGEPWSAPKVVLKGFLKRARSFDETIMQANSGSSQNRSLPMYVTAGQWTQNRSTGVSPTYAGPVSRRRYCHQWYHRSVSA